MYFLFFISLASTFYSFHFFLPLFYGCMEEVLVFLAFHVSFFSSGMEMEWKEKGVGCDGGGSW